MPADETGTSTDPITDPAAAGAAAGDAPAGEATTPPAGAEQTPSPEDGLEDWVKVELRKVRGEAANYRTQLREAQAALAKAKTAEEFEAATSELNDKVTKLEQDILRASVAAEHKLPSDLAALLQGATKEELDAHAKVLAKYAPAEERTPEQLAGGLDPAAGEDEDAGLSPAELAAKYAARRR